MQRIDVLIIGSGLSAATLALSLPERLRIAVVTKQAGTDSSSYWAQGGIAAPAQPVAAKPAAKPKAVAAKAPAPAPAPAVPAPAPAAAPAAPAK